MQNDLGLRDIARLVAPDADIVSASDPEPMLKAINVVAIFDSQETSRNAVLGLESMENDDAAIGLVALGHEARTVGIQPEDSTITNETLGRAAKGALVGAVVAALLIGAGTALFSVNGIVIGAAVGGALFGAFIGGVWGAFVRFGGSSAYRQSFVRNDHGVTLVSLHTDDRAEAEEAERVLGLQSASPPMVFHRDGDRLWADD